MKIDDLEIRIDQIIQLCSQTQKTKRSSEWGSYVDTTLFNQLRSASLSFLKSVFGADHPLYLEFDKNAKEASAYDADEAMGILKAAKDEIVGGWIFSMKSLVSAEIFSDFLEMAEYLLKEGYKDPAAVMAGSTLEEHLRQLCIKNLIPIDTIKGTDTVFKKADTLNADLANAMIYNKLDQKSITAWLDLRNKAAHGKYSEYSLEQVRNMFDGITNFIARTS
jgi:hypothetical protein